MGILEDDFVMVDIDTPTEAKLLLKIIDSLSLGCAVLKTNKGIHIYFKGYELRKNNIEWYSAIGVKVTTKLGSKNTADPLRINGKSRRWIRKTDSFDPLPKWIAPMDKKKNHITDIDEGNRNQELFSYILKLQSVGMNKREIRETIRIINKFILSKSLSDDEINVILRDEAFMKESFFENKRFQVNKFAKYMISEHNIVNIGKQLHIYKDGEYVSDTVEIERTMLNDIDSLSMSQRREVLSYLTIKAPEVKVMDYHHICFNNGVFSINDWKLIPHSPNLILKNKVPVDYIEGYFDESVNTVLNKITCKDKTLREVLEEVLGYTLIRSNRYVKTILLTSSKARNGKSTFINMIKGMLGEENYTTLQFNELGQRFKTANLYSKLANVGDDISAETLKDSSIWKSLSTGGTINIERKGGDPFDFSNYATLIFACNQVPYIKDTTGGTIERMLIIPFNAYFSKKDSDYDPNIEDKVVTPQAKHYLVQLALKGLKRLTTNKGFTQSKIIDRAVKDYEVQNNNVLTYLNELEPKIENEATADVYRIYSVWCVENGFEPFTHIHFSREVCKVLNLDSKRRSINGKQVRCYIKK
ncbi:phage/plasmid primase, P4 family [Enterococcus avium]|uniref:phage/plasmid primase, P4 family n=1 Tax=Enterococcus avium TaxID=33945 RepID=UPI0032E42BC0